MRKDIAKEIKMLKDTISILNEQVKKLENILSNEEMQEINISPFVGIEKDDVVLSEFISYLQEVKHLKSGSIKDYIGELRKIKNKLHELEGVDLPYEIYEISDIATVKKIQKIFQNNGDLVRINRDSHHSLSAAINNYCVFLEYKKTDFVFDED